MAPTTLTIRLLVGAPWPNDRPSTMTVSTVSEFGSRSSRRASSTAVVEGDLTTLPLLWSAEQPVVVIDAALYDSKRSGRNRVTVRSME